MTTPNGVILWEGPSALDGAPVVVIATGLGRRGSRNAKTGRMVQTWILRQDVNPQAATKTGDDASVCGQCPHRPALGGSCYVKVFQAPRSVWDGYRRGIYPRAAVTDLAQIFEGHYLRLGSYGDPAAAPLAMWQAAVSRAAGVTGYTHQWREAPEFRAVAMASVDSFAEGLEARAAGWRTFRIRTAGEALQPKAEFVCPASAEAGHKASCAECKACGGLDAKAKASPVIIAHGSTARRFALYRQGRPDSQTQLVL